MSAPDWSQRLQQKPLSTVCFILFNYDTVVKKKKNPPNKQTPNTKLLLPTSTTLFMRQCVAPDFELILNITFRKIFPEVSNMSQLSAT